MNARSQNMQICANPLFHYITDQFVSEEDAHVNALDLGILRGYGVFDYVQVYKGIPFHLKDHLIRLEWSCKQVGIAMTKSIDEMTDLVYDLIAKNGPHDAGIRFVILGGEPDEDLLLPKQHSSLLILFHPYKPFPEEIYATGMKVITTNLLRLLPGVKTTNYLPAILAMKKAKESGFNDVLYINNKNEILEGTTSNVFFFKNGTWITSNSDQMVKGVTRSIFIELIKDIYPIEYRSLPLNEISSCEEAFLSSSIKDAVPLVQIDSQKVGSGNPGKHTSLMREKFRSYLQNYLKNHYYQKKGIHDCSIY